MLAFLAKYYYNIIIYSGQKGCIDMCNCENEEKGSVLPVIMMIISAVSFILGIAAGTTLTKKICEIFSISESLPQIFSAGVVEYKGKKTIGNARNFSATFFMAEIII